MPCEGRAVARCGEGAGSLSPEDFRKAADLWPCAVFNNPGASAAGILAHQNWGKIFPGGVDEVFQKALDKGLTTKH